MTTGAKIRITAQDDSDPAFKKAISNIDALKASAGGIATSLAGPLAIASLGFAALTAKIKTAVDGLDRLNDLKDASGASIENLSALEDVAIRTGTSMDTVSTAVIKLNKALSAAKPDTEIASAFEAIGLSAEKLKALDPAEALLQTGVALSKYADDGDKARVVQIILGKSLKEVAPLLKDLAEKGRLVATVTTAQAEEAEKFNKELFNLQKNSIDSARALSGPLIESLNILIAKFREGKAAGAGLFETAANIYANNVRRFLGLETKQLNTGGATGDFGPGSGAGRGFVKDERFKPGVGDIFGGNKPEKPKAPKGSAGPKKDPITDAQRALAQYVESLAKVIEKEQELTAVEKALNFLRTQGVQGQIPQVRELVLGLAAQVDLEKDLADRLKLKRNLALEAGDAVNKSNEEYQALLSRLLEATPSNKLAQQRSDVQLLTAEFEAGRLTETLYLEAVKARLDLVGDGLQDLSTFAQRAAKTVQESLGDTLSNALQGNFSDIGSNFTKMINRMVAEAASAQIVESLFGKLTKPDDGGSAARTGGVFSGVFEDFFKSIFRFADGGVVNGPGSGTSDSIAAWLSNGEHVTNAAQTRKWLPLLSAINSGEIDRAPRFAAGGLVGKFSSGATQPMFSPSGQTRANDNTDSERSGGSVTVNQNFTVGDVATASMVRQAVAGSERRIAAGIGRSQRYGGALA